MSMVDGPTKEPAVPSPSSTSSIGRDSDVSSDGDGEGEVQSSYKGALDRMDDLEHSLPIRQGISNFYHGKSKSFTCLDDVSSSAKDIAKPDNPYNRKRKNLLATHIRFNDNTNVDFSLTRSAGKNDVSKTKRSANSRREEAGLSTSASSSTSASEESLSSRLPPQHPHGKTVQASNASPPHHHLSFASRSFSLVDMQNTSTGSSPSGED